MLLQKILKLLSLPFEVDDSEVDVLPGGAHIEVKYSFEDVFKKVFSLDVGHSLMIILGPLLRFIDVQLFYSPFVYIF